MLRSVKRLEECAIQATDGEIGRVDDLYFDDDHWAIRYLVANTGGWLMGRRVLLSPVSVTGAEWEEQRLHVNLTQRQVEESPEIDLDAPFSRRRERGLLSFFGWPIYWGGTGLWGFWMYPGMLAASGRGDADGTGADGTDADGSRERIVEDAAPAEAEDDNRLRSSQQVIGYRIHALDGEIGHVDDFLVDDETWAIRYLAIDTSNWLPGKRVLVPPQWLDRVDWTESSVWVDLTREAIRNAPAWDPAVALTREYEEQLFDYYGRRKYWEDAELRRAA